MESNKLERNKKTIIPDSENGSKFNDGLDPSRLAKQVLIRGESKKEFIGFAEKILKETPTSTEIEKEFVKKYIFSMWKLKRARVMEKNLLNSQQKFSQEEVYLSETKRRIRNLKRIHLNEELQKIINYQDRLEKQAMKALKQLKEFSKSL